VAVRPPQRSAFPDSVSSAVGPTRRER
jgi:hypothetical protein